MKVYEKLLEVRRRKPVYVLSSHSHFVMEGIFNTRYWQEHGSVLPGWIIGAGGAFRYALPPGTNRQDPIHFDCRELTEAAVPIDVAQRFGPDFIHRCYQENSQD